MQNQTPVEQAYCSFLQQKKSFHYSDELQRYHDAGVFATSSGGTLKAGRHALYHSHKVLSQAKRVYDGGSTTVSTKTERVCVVKFMDTDWNEITVVQAVASRQTIQVLSSTQVILYFNLPDKVAVPDRGIVVISALDDDNSADDIIQMYDATVTEETTMITTEEELVSVNLVTNDMRASSLAYRMPQSVLEFVRDVKLGVLSSLGLVVTVAPDPVALDELYSTEKSIGAELSRVAPMKQTKKTAGGQQTIGADSDSSSPEAVVADEIRSMLQKSKLTNSVTCAVSQQNMGVQPETQFYVAGSSSRRTYSFPSVSRILITASVRLYYHNNYDQIASRADEVFTRLFSREATDPANRMRDIHVDAVGSRHSKTRRGFVSPLEIYAMLLIARERAEKLATGTLKVSALGDALLDMFRRAFGNQSDPADPSFLRYVPLLSDLLSGSSGLPVNLFSSPDKLFDELMTLKLGQKPTVSRDEVERYIAQHLSSSEPVANAGSSIRQSPVANLVLGLVVPEIDRMLDEFLNSTLRQVSTLAKSDYKLSGGMIGFLLAESITDVDMTNMLATVSMTHDAALALLQIAVRVSLRSQASTPFERALSWSMTELANIYDDQGVVNQFISSEQASISWGYTQPSAYENKDGIQLQKKPFGDGRLDVYGFSASMQATQSFSRVEEAERPWWSCTRVFYSFATTNADNQETKLPYSTALMLDMSTGLSMVCTFLPSPDTPNLVEDQRAQLNVVTEFVNSCKRIQAALVPEEARKIIARDGLRALRVVADISRVMALNAVAGKQASEKRGSTTRSSRNAADYFGLIKAEFFNKELVFFAGKYSLQSRTITVSEADSTSASAAATAPDLVLSITSGDTSTTVRLHYDPLFERGEYRVQRSFGSTVDLDIPVYFSVMNNYGPSKLKVILLLYNSDLYTDISVAPDLILRQAVTVDKELGGDASALLGGAKPDAMVFMSNSKFKTLVAKRKELAGPQNTKSNKRALSNAGFINGPLQAIGQVLYPVPVGYYEPYPYSSPILPFIFGLGLGALARPRYHRHYYDRRPLGWGYRKWY
jgi:hypothetical protein